jgi:hypothetical protein
MLCYPIRGIRSAVLRAPLSPTRPASGGPRWERGRYREPHWRTRTARKAAVESMSPCAEPALSPVGDSLDDIRPGSSRGGHLLGHQWGGGVTDGGEG